MDLSSNTNDIHFSQPRKKRKISFKRSQVIRYSTRHPSNDSSFKRKIPHKPPKPTLKHQVEPWWIGQRILIQVPCSQNNETKYRYLEASIRDYDASKQLTHIWYETEQNNFENIDLSELDEWDIANSKPLHKQIEFVPDNDWTPFYWKMGQRVMVRFDGKHGNGLKFEAFIDGFDPISRRHHLNYGDTTEWIWATKERVQIYKNRCAEYIETNLQRFENKQYRVTPPPWNPLPYGLDATFAEKSREIEGRRKENLNIVQAKKQNLAQQKKIFGNKTAPRRYEQMHEIEGRPISRLMKTKKRNRKKIRLAVAGKEPLENDISSAQSCSSESTVDNKRCQNGSDSYTESGDEFNKNNRMKSNNKQNTEAIQVSVTTNIVVTNNTKKRKSSTRKKKISLRIPKKSLKKHIRKMSVNTKIINENNTDSNAAKDKKPHNKTIDGKDLLNKTKSHKKRSKYPRNPIIKGEQWKRHYSRNDRKYYWLLTDDSGAIIAKEWDPWRINEEKAPWMTSIQHWGKFMDNAKGEYYYNYNTKKSTFRRPQGFESDAEIECDSADDSCCKTDS